MLACSQSTEISTEVPVCIQLMLDDQDPFVEIKTVQVQEVAGELHYWVNTDATHWDGVEDIVNNQCERLCQFCGECLFPECTKQYKDNKWTIIWEK